VYLNHITIFKTEEVESESMDYIGIFDEGVSCNVKEIISKVHYAHTRAYSSNVHH
jgi:hypothetical protein